MVAWEPPARHSHGQLASTDPSKHGQTDSPTFLSTKCRAGEEGTHCTTMNQSDTLMSVLNVSLLPYQYCTCLIAVCIMKKYLVMAITNAMSHVIQEHNNRQDNMASSHWLSKSGLAQCAMPMYIIRENPASPIKRAHCLCMVSECSQQKPIDHC